MSRTQIKFGKVQYGEKPSTVVVEVELSEKDEGVVFTAMALLKQGRREVMGGQCFDELYNETSLKDDEKFCEIYELWKKHHLNDMHAGTVSQEQALDEKYGDNYPDYDVRCEYLKEIGLLEDNGYRYGTSWLYREIPADDLERIRKYVKED